MVYVFFSFFCRFFIASPHVSHGEKGQTRPEIIFMFYVVQLQFDLNKKSCFQIYITAINDITRSVTSQDPTNSFASTVPMTQYQSKLHYLCSLTKFVAVFVCVCIQTQHGICNKSIGCQQNPNKNIWDSPHETQTATEPFLNDPLGLFSHKAFLTFWIDLFLHCQALHH